ncbi:selenium cofactor biosynthesis protein YqeC [soil metagenome]|jgi:probable selenium-dependent hydroxylase accessory protein YqeC
MGWSLLNVGFTGGRESVLRLCEAIGISSGDIAAFVGAGGKSSAIRTAAAELSAAGLSVIVVPTTKLMVEEAEAIGPIAVSEDPAERTAKIKSELSNSKTVVAGSAIISKNRIGGVEPDEVAALSNIVDVVLVEADGARGKWMKGTAEHEPPIPASATVVVGVSHIGAFGLAATEENVHRPELFSALTGVGPGQSITARAIALALADGSLANLPDKARSTVLITGVGPGKSMSDASVVARELWRAGVKNVILSSLTKEPPDQIWIP